MVVCLCGVSAPAQFRRDTGTGRYITANIVTVVWVPDYVKGSSSDRYAVQLRDENDFLYRARHLSEWVCPSVDPDEYFAPTQMYTSTRETERCSFDVEGVVNASVDDAKLSSLFFPIHPYLEQVPATIVTILFLKWPTVIPSESQAL
jgi:hypothetical protein